MSPGGHARCPRVGHATRPTAGRAARPRVPNGAGGATCPQQGRARRPCPSLGAPGLLRVLLAGDTQRWGGGRWPRSGARGAGARSRGAVVPPPVPPTGCQGGGRRGCSPHRPRCTPQTRPEEVQRSPEQGDSCDTPGCRTRPPSPPAAPGSAGGPWAALGTLTPPGHPAQSHPINRVQGSPLSMATPGGAGEGARR